MAEPYLRRVLPLPTPLGCPTVANHRTRHPLGSPGPGLTNIQILLQLTDLSAVVTPLGEIPDQALSLVITKGSSQWHMPSIPNKI